MEEIKEETKEVREEEVKTEELEVVTNQFAQKKVFVRPRKKGNARTK